MDGGELPPVVLLNRAVAWKVWMGPYVSSVHTVLTQEGHLQQRLEEGMIKRPYLEFAVEVGPLVSEEASDDVETMLVSATRLSRTPVEPLVKKRIE